MAKGGFLSRIDGLSISSVEAAVRELELFWQEASEQDREDSRQMTEAFRDFGGISWEEVTKPSSDEELRRLRLEAVYHFMITLGRVYQLKASGHLAGDVARLKQALLGGLGAEPLE